MGMTEDTLVSAFHALQQRRVREWERLDPPARRALKAAIDDVRCEIARREGERKQFPASWGQWHEVR